MADTWTVVKFREENSVEAIPTTWLMGNDHCYWPPYTHEKIQQAIKKHDQPNTCWPLHKIIEIFKSGTYDNYLQARTKAKKAENESDLNSNLDMSKRRVRRRKVISSDDSSKSSTEELDTVKWHKKCSQKKLTAPPKIPTISSTGYSVQSRSQLDDPVLVIPAILDSVSSKSIDDELFCCCCRVHRSGDSLRNIVKQQVLVRNILTQILEDIQNLRILQPTYIRDETHPSIFARFSFFPISSDEHLILVEEYLENEMNFRATVDEFSKLGGNNLYDFIKRCLNVAISNSFASQFSWHGAKKKRIFGNLKLAKILLGASEQSKLSENQKATEEAVKKWLRRAKERSENVKVGIDNNKN